MGNGLHFAIMTSNSSSLLPTFFCGPNTYYTSTIKDSFSSSKRRPFDSSTRENVLDIIYRWPLTSSSLALSSTTRCVSAFSSQVSPVSYGLCRSSLHPCFVFSRGHQVLRASEAISKTLGCDNIYCPMLKAVFASSSGNHHRRSDLC